MSSLPWVQRPKEAQRTHEAIIRSFPGRVLTVTVLASHKRPFSFDSCVPSAKRFRENSGLGVQNSQAKRSELAVVDVIDVTHVSDQTARTIAALLATGHDQQLQIPCSLRVMRSASSSSAELALGEPGDFPLLIARSSVVQTEFFVDEN